jgi:hypothetical protein
MEKGFLFLLWEPITDNYVTPESNCKKGPHMTHTATGARTRHIHRTILDRLRVRSTTNQADVHFHQGPQGEPAPCFDERCPNPRLAV